MSKFFFITTLLIVVFPLLLSAQTKFEEGYFIDNNDVKQQCFIRNIGKEGKGEDYIYKLNMNDDSKPVTVESIKEFGIEGSLRFISDFIKLDISDNTIKNVKDTVNHARIEEGHAFLNQHIKSEAASLYSYFYEGITYFFYQVGNSAIHYLVYKKYEVEVASGVTTKYLLDNRYQKQLTLSLPCSVDASTVSYNLLSLLNYLETYINEQNDLYVTYKKRTSGKLVFQITGGYNHLSLFVGDETMQDNNFDFGTQNTFSYGIGLEYLFPGNKNKWGFFTEAGLIQFSSYIEDSQTGSVSHATYKYVELPIGVLYNINLSNTLKLFIKTGISPNFVLNDSKVLFNSPNNQRELESTANGFAGIGLNYNRFSAEIRTYSKRNITQAVYNKGSSFNQYSFRIACNLFQVKGK